MCFFCDLPLLLIAGGEARVCRLFLREQTATRSGIGGTLLLRPSVWEFCRTVGGRLCPVSAPVFASMRMLHACSLCLGLPA